MKDLMSSMRSEADELLRNVAPKNKSQLVFKYKQKIRQLKNELLVKEDSMQTLQRNIKYTKMKEYEVQIV